MTREGVTRVVYLCTADATRMVRREADRQSCSATTGPTRHDHRVRQTRHLDRQIRTIPERMGVDADRGRRPERDPRVARHSSRTGRRGASRPREPALLGASWQASPVRDCERSAIPRSLPRPGSSPAGQVGIQNQAGGRTFLATIEISKARGDFLRPEDIRLTIAELGERGLPTNLI